MIIISGQAQFFLREMRNIFKWEPCATRPGIKYGAKWEEVVVTKILLIIHHDIYKHRSCVDYNNAAKLVKMLK